MSWAKTQKQISWYRWFCPPVHSMYIRLGGSVRWEARGSHSPAHITYSEHLARLGVSLGLKHTYNIRSWSYTMAKKHISIHIIWTYLLHKMWNQGVFPNKLFPTTIQAFYLSFNGSTIDFFKSKWSDSNQNVCVHAHQHWVRTRIQNLSGDVVSIWHLILS